MRLVAIIVMLLASKWAASQELFVYTEPASNMAAKSIGVRITNNLMRESATGKNNFLLVPEIMFGVSKKIMVHAEGFLDSRRGLEARGAALYMKYRFYSIDDVHSHTRMAAFAKGAYNNLNIHQPAIDLNGYNSGYETGIVVTKLIYKLALSASGSWLHATDNGNENKFPVGNTNRDAVAYTLSAGRLILPLDYTDYKQTNINVMTEMLGQTNSSNGATYIDLAPSLQFIFLSKIRLDLGYRLPIVKSLMRSSGNVFLVRLEYNFFNVFK